MRQPATAPGLGFDAMIAFRLGLEDNGMGGGASGVVSGMVSGVAGEGRFEGTGGGAGALLLKPISNAERTGGGATTLLVLLLCVVEPFGVGLAGIGGGLSGDTSCTLDFRGGSVGGVGGPDFFSCGGNAWLGTYSLLLFIALSVALLCFVSSGAFLAGSGGSFEGSYAGARTW